MPVLNVSPAIPISFANPDPGASSNIDIGSAAANAPNGATAGSGNQVAAPKQVTVVGVLFNNPS